MVRLDKNVMFFLTPNYFQSKGQHQFLVVILGIFMILSTSSSILLSSLSGVMSAFPAPYITALVAGQAASGILATLFQILSLLSRADPATSAMYYFISADVLLALTFVCYLGVRKTVSLLLIEGCKKPA